MYRASLKRYMQELASLAAIGTFIAIVGLSSYSVYATVSLQERYMGDFWLYSLPEYEAAEWTTTTANNRIVAGDVKVSYLLKGYFDLDVDVFQGLRYSVGKGSEPEILFTYGQMLTNGYVLYGGCSVDLPEGWTDKVLDLSLVYSNGLVSIHTQAKKT